MYEEKYSNYKIVRGWSLLWADQFNIWGFDDKHVIERGAQVEQITSDGTIVASSAYAAKLSEIAG